MALFGSNEPRSLSPSFLASSEVIKNYSDDFPEREPSERIMDSRSLSDTLSLNL